MGEQFETGEAEIEGNSENRKPTDVEQETSRDLSDVTHDAEAVLERSGDIAEAEAIEAELTELVSAVLETAVPTATDQVEVGAKDDPRQEYSGVLLREGEILQDQDWNEDESTVEVALDSIDGESKDDRPTEEVAAAEQDWSTSGDADDRPTEEIVTIGEATAPPMEESSVEVVDRTTSGDADDRPTEEVVAAEQGWSTSGDADDRPTEEITSATIDVFTRALLEEEYFQKLLENPDSALEEHGLRQQDLPDLSDPNAPEAVTIIQGVEGAVLEGMQILEQPPVRDDRPPDDSDDMRRILLQNIMDRGGTAIPTLSKLMGKSHDTIKSIIQNMK